MPTAAVNGTDIHYEDTGGDGPAVIFSHGILMDHSMFDQQVAALSTEYRVITWDERGHGGTAAPGPFTFWDSAMDVFGLLDHLDLDSAVLGGMSQGGFVSLRAALLEPDRVRGLILIDTQAGLEDPANAESYQQLHDIWMDQGPGPVQEIVAAIILGPGTWDDWFAKWAATDRKQFSQAFTALMAREDITSRLGEISCPALVIHGTADAAIPMDKAEVLEAGLGGRSRLAVIDGGTHSSNMSHPDAVNALVLNFLRTLEQ